MKLERSAGSKIHLVLLMVLLGIGLAGCNTMEGFGKDVEATGEKIEDEAN
ncbi:entericidin A/B family lipoprotein [Marinobacter sp.]